mgnify:CR=1 FL=1
MKYKVVFGSTDKFVDLVNDMIRDGWEPQGGVSVVNDSMVGYIAFQAMIKRDKE